MIFNPPAIASIQIYTDSKKYISLIKKYSFSEYILYRINNIPKEYPWVIITGRDFEHIQMIIQSNIKFEHIRGRFLLEKFPEKFI